MGIRTRSGAPLLKPEIAAPLAELITEREVVTGGTLPPTESAKLQQEYIEGLDEEIKHQGIYQVRGPGLVWLRPFIDKVVTVNVTHRTTPIPEGFDLESVDDRQFRIIPSVTWYVRSDGDNPYKARFKINNEKDNKDEKKDDELEQTVAWICARGLGIVLRNKTTEDLINHDPAEVTQGTRERCADELLDYGVELHDVRLKPVVRTPQEVLKQGIENTQHPSDAAMIPAAAALAEGDKGTILSLVPREPA